MFETETDRPYLVRKLKRWGHCPPAPPPPPPPLQWLRLFIKDGISESGLIIFLLTACLSGWIFLLATCYVSVVIYVPLASICVPRNCKVACLR